jgi:hypothetical protein
VLDVKLFMANLTGEFNQGLGPMLSVRGEGILSWIGDNNFVVEDKIAATHEVVHYICFSCYLLFKPELDVKKGTEKESLSS